MCVCVPITHTYIYTKYIYILYIYIFTCVYIYIDHSPILSIQAKTGFASRRCPRTAALKAQSLCAIASYRIPCIDEQSMNPVTGLLFGWLVKRLTAAVVRFDFMVRIYEDILRIY